MEENELESFPVSQYPCEFIAFFILEIPTDEGSGYCFLAVDAFTEYTFNLGVENEITDEIVLKHIYYLTEHPEFSPVQFGRSYNLVVEFDYNIYDRIVSIIEPSGGNLIVDMEFMDHIAKPFLDTFLKNFNSGSTFYD